MQYHNDGHTNPLGTLTNFTNHMLAGKLPLDVQDHFAGGRLCALEKGEHDVRPIADGETLRRLVSKVACLSVKARARKIFKGHQYGVATPAGAERVIHLCRQAFAARTEDDDFVLCKIDLRNAFNQVSRDWFIALTREHFPTLTPYVEWCYTSESKLTFGTRVIKSREGVQQGDPLGPLLFSLVMREVASEIHAAAPKLDLSLWYLDDGVLAGTSCDVRHAFDVIEMKGPQWGLHLNAAKCEIITHPASSHRSSVFPDLPGPNKNLEGNFYILGSPVGSPEFCREYLVNNAVEMAEDSLDAITHLEDPQVALSLIRHCTGFCQMVYSLRTTPTSELRDLCRRLDDAVQRAVENFFRPLTPEARRQTQRNKRFGGLGLRSAEEHSTSAYIASVAFASELDRWDPTEAEGFEEAVSDVNKRVGKDIVDIQSGRIPKGFALSSTPPFSKRGITESSTETVIPRQRDLSDAISSHEFHQALSLADPRTRARWISETGHGAAEWAFVLPSKKNGHAYTPTEFRTLVRWWRIVGYKGVLNGDLFSQLDGKLRSLKHDFYSIYMCKVKGHSGNKWNEEADGLALIAARKVPRPPEQKKRKTSNDSNASQIDKSLEKLIKHRTLEKGKTKTNPAPKRGAEAKVKLCGKIAKTGGKRAPS